MSDMSLKCIEKNEEVVCFKCFVWIVWWWFLANRNMHQCRCNLL